MAFDYKKEYKEFYLPPKKPGIVTVPAMNFLAVRGKGDPNEEGGLYKQALGMLYAVAFTIKMSKLGKHQLVGYFDYVVPPLEGLWWQDGVQGVDYAHKESFQWISMIRLPEFVTREAFDWAIGEATEKKKQDFSPVEFLPGRRGCASSACISVPTTTSLPLSRLWRSTPKPRAWSWTLGRIAFTTRSTSAMCGVASRSG